MTDSFARAYVQVIRIAKADSAWIYHVLEAHEGIVSYSTLPETGGEADLALLSPAGLPCCELALTIPESFLGELRQVLDHLRTTGVWIHELDQPKLEEAGN
jgi:hypothetical protein